MSDTAFTLTPEQEKLARRRAGAKKGWTIHAIVFVLVNLVLLFKSAAQGTGWAVYPAFGWGIGLLVHGFVVFFAGSGSGLHQSLLERERQRLQRQA